MKDDLWHLTRPLKCLQHDMLQPETGQHMEYAGNVTHRGMNRIMAITTCIYGWWKALSLFLHKANFSLQQRNVFYLTTKFVEIIDKVPPNQSHINNQ